ncbi:uncharacterized protein PG986_011139 [Apiospora aurea]|uniref:Gfo/Idh/MocA-like oxidoreductase N-terminal domain-containing protein n=1 Tax=Apiospora aurea TaxID=335848 RepID=A0ABR1Q492_9PEZI
MIPEAYRVALVGLGDRGYKTHFLGLNGSPSEVVVAACDTSQKLLSEFALKHPDVPAYCSVDDLVAAHQSTAPVDFAIVCVPHGLHGRCVETLAAANIPVLKEKPAANNVDEYEALLGLPVPVGVMFQKRFEPRYQQLKSLLPSLGRIVSFRGALERNIDHLASTWRAAGVDVAVS